MVRLSPHTKLETIKLNCIKILRVPLSEAIASFNCLASLFLSFHYYMASRLHNRSFGFRTKNHFSQLSDSNLRRVAQFAYYLIFLVSPDPQKLFKLILRLRREGEKSCTFLCDYRKRSAMISKRCYSTLFAQ